MVAGGLLDQPLLWFRVQYAGYVYHLLERTSAKGFQFDQLSASDVALYRDIVEARVLPPH